MCVKMTQVMTSTTIYWFNILKYNSQLHVYKSYSANSLVETTLPRSGGSHGRLSYKNR